MTSDARFAVRQLVKAPGFTLAVVVALALGIGANTAIFTVVNTVLLHPLPYPHSDRMVNIARQGSGPVSVPMFAFWERSATGFEDLAAHQAPTLSTLNGPDRPESIGSIRVSFNYFGLFGANPVLGRTFRQTEDRPGGANVAVISYDLWNRRFAADPSILGRTLIIEGISYSVVGVLSQSFHAYPEADIWMPLQADAASTDQAGVLTVDGRLPADMTLSAARARMSAIGQLYVQTDARQLGDGKIQVTPLQQQVTGDVRPALLILLGAVGLVLLIACANVANLLLARATSRRKELAIRIAIGASRGRIVRQLLTESVLLALAGGAAGLVAGSWGVRAFVAFAPKVLPRIQEIAPVPALDPGIAGFTFLLSMVTVLLFGLFPAMRLSRFDSPGAVLKPNRPHAVLIAVEMAIAIVLLCGAVLLTRSVVALQNVELGFDPQNLLTMQMTLGGPNYSRSSDVDRLVRLSVDGVARIPGVESVALASALPLFGEMDMIFNIPGRPVAEGHKFSGDVQWRFISPNYFEVLRTPLLSGRFMSSQETGSTVVINQAMARQFWPGADPVGQTISVGPGLGPDFEQGTTEIVGVVADERVRLDVDSAPMMYQMPQQISDAAMKLMNRLQPVAILVRARPGVSPMSLSHAVEQEWTGLARQPVGKIRTMDQVRLDSTARQNFNRTLLVLFAASATLLAAVGMYSVMSYSVEQRTQEIGIRAALGASRSHILKFMLIRALRMILAGAAVGVMASYGMTSLLRGQLYGVRPTDPITFVVAPLILITFAIAAAAIPAARASRVDPIVALRHE